MKKVLSLVLVAMLVLSLAPVALAAPAVTYGFSNAAYGVAYGAAADLESKIEPIGGNELVLYLYTDAKTPVTNEEATLAKLDVTFRVTSGERVVKNAAMVSYNKKTEKDKTAAVKVTFDGDWAGTGTVSYKFNLYVTVNSKRDVASETAFEGKYAHFVNKIDGTYVYAYLGDNVPILDSDGYVKSLEVEVENGITLATKVFKGKKYFAKVKAGITGDDDAMLTKYPDIMAIYRFTSSGWGSDTTVKLVNETAAKPVYGLNEAGDDLEYLGTTKGGDLPVAKIYYVADKELDIVETSVDEPEEEPTTTDSYDEGGETGGDEVPANVNDNPGTGC